MPQAFRLALAAAALAACAPPLPASPPTHRGALTAACTGCRDLRVVAHEDDDLLFMNPDIVTSIRAGNTLRTLYLTAGDAGRAAVYWQGREAGEEAAYAAMAEVEDAWTTSTLTVAGGQTIRLRTLAAAPAISLAFVSLPDGNGSGSGFAAYGDQSLEKLWSATLPTLTTVDGANQYGRAELIDALAAVIADFHPDHLATQDGTGVFGYDHSDHLHAARFAFEAQRRYAPVHSFTVHRDYDISGDAENLSPAEREEKSGFFDVYAPHDPAICGGQVGSACGYASGWVGRQYSATRLAPLAGHLVGVGGMCLAVQGGDPTSGAPIVLADCAEAPEQSWKITEDGAIVGLQGKCLDVKGGAEANGTPLEIDDCTGEARQRFSLFNSGLLRGPGAKCVDVDDGQTAPGTAVQLWACADVPQQRFTVELHAAAPWSSGGDFGDGDLGALPASYRSVRLGDVDGDGRADACARKADGVYCALATGGTGFAAASRFVAAFTDAQGWDASAYGTTLQLADVDGDGRADLCGRGPGGIVCARSTGSAFASPTPWSAGADFSDAAGWNAAPSYYGSIRFADVDGDGAIDVCGRLSDGVRCARNSGAGHFAPATLWLGGEFTDGLGWKAVEHGATLMLGDVNGDGRADVCGRGSATILCALANAGGDGFDRAHRWAFRGEFSNAAGWSASAAYYGSLRLADLDGDGFADLCGRGPGGIVCAYSNGQSFGTARPVMPRAYTDAGGWNDDRYGPTVQLADLDGDGRADLCGRSASGLVCAVAP